MCPALCLRSQIILWDMRHKTVSPSSNFPSHLCGSYDHINTPPTFLKVAAGAGITFGLGAYSYPSQSWGAVRETNGRSAGWKWDEVIVHILIEIVILLAMHSSTCSQNWDGLVNSCTKVSHTFVMVRHGQYISGKTDEARKLTGLLYY